MALSPERAKEPRSISIVIPVYNEKSYLPTLVERLVAVQWGMPCELIFIDDCSTDGSYELLQAVTPRHANMRLLRNEQNRGKSLTLQAGFDAAVNDIIVVQDADLEYHPRELPKLIEPIARGEADVVFGSRFKNEVRQVHRTYHRYINVFLTSISNLCSGVYLSDMETCYKVFRADILKKFVIRSRRFGFEPEITAYIAKFDFRIFELPISYFPRTRLQGKKINAWDGVQAIWYIIKFNFFYSPGKCLKNDSPARTKAEENLDRRSARTG